MILNIYIFTPQIGLPPTFQSLSQDGDDLDTYSLLRRKVVVHRAIVVLEKLFKGTVSPDIGFYFRVYTLKSVLSVRPLMAYKLVYFLVL
jgi:hypothetical protein